MKVIEETKLVKQVVILGKTVYRMRVTTSTFENQLYLPQQWSNLRFIGPIYELLRYFLQIGNQIFCSKEYKIVSGPTWAH